MKDYICEENKIVCPYCGYETSDDLQDYEDYEEDEVECGSCEKTFLLTTQPILECTTYKLEVQANG